VAKERGIDLLDDLRKSKAEDAESGDIAHTVRAYTKMAYCAAISSWEVEAVDNPDQGEFPYEYADFFAWAWKNPREFGRTLQDILVALSGKSVREFLAEQKAADVKKKPSRRPASLLSRIGRLWKRSS
jgi:hypothetical protein